MLSGVFPGELQCPFSGGVSRRAPRSARCAAMTFLLNSLPGGSELRPVGPERRLCGHQGQVLDAGQSARG